MVETVNCSTNTNDAFGRLIFSDANEYKLFLNVVDKLLIHVVFNDIILNNINRYSPCSLVMDISMSISLRLIILSLPKTLPSHTSGIREYAILPAAPVVMAK